MARRTAGQTIGNSGVLCTVANTWIGVTELHVQFPSMSDRSCHLWPASMGPVNRIMILFLS